MRGEGDWLSLRVSGVSEEVLFRDQRSHLAPHSSSIFNVLCSLSRTELVEKKRGGGEEGRKDGLVKVKRSSFTRKETFVVV